MKALLAGATGMCGYELLRLLLESSDFEKVYILVRKPLEEQHPKLIQIVTNYENIDQDLATVYVDYIYCCLGTTIKKAGSQEAFNQVDNLYVQQLVNWGEKRAVKYFGVISAMGANSQSKIFYSRVKGEMEEYVISKNIKHISIYRPSLLLGNRTEKRAGEKIATIFMLLLNPLLALFFKSYQAIAGKTVALAMYNESIKATPQKYTYTNKHLFDLAKI